MPSGREHTRGGWLAEHAREDSRVGPHLDGRHQGVDLRPPHLQSSKPAFCFNVLKPHKILELDPGEWVSHHQLMAWLLSEIGIASDHVGQCERVPFKGKEQWLSEKF